jgi:hypothetical protein
MTFVGFTSFDPFAAQPAGVAATSASDDCPLGAADVGSDLDELVADADRIATPHPEMSQRFDERLDVRGLQRIHPSDMTEPVSFSTQRISLSLMPLWRRRVRKEQV